MSRRVERVLYVNSTRQCNVECTRCYLTPAHRRAAERLEPELLAGVLSHRYFRDADDVLVMLQGGEIALVGEDLVRRYLSLVRRYPNARAGVVTNLLVLPAWLIHLAEAGEVSLETTFALGEKHTLDGSRARYLARFVKNLQSLVAAGISCPVNVELNRETWRLGPEALVEVVLATGARTWEFDVSVDFARFRRDPHYAGSYPILPTTLSYAELAEYAARLWDEHGHRLASVGFECGLIEQVRLGAQTNAFNVRREVDFITVNPDGAVTTNPLFSDLVPTYIGNLHVDSFDAILANPRRQDRIAYEAARVRSCVACEFFSLCQGGPSHVPLRDESGECAGLYSLWSRFDGGNERGERYG